MSERRRGGAISPRVLAVVLAVVAGLLAGCASVPSSSPVQVLRQVSGAEAVAPPAPNPGSDPQDLVRGFIDASASSAEKHSAARRFLTADAAAGWDDSTSITVLIGRANAILQDQTADSVRITITGTSVGVIDPVGAFQPSQSDFKRDVDLVRRDGQWRISQLPGGVFVERDTFQRTYRRTNVWFVDPSRRTVVPDVRYVALEPRQTQPARLMEMLLKGPSSALDGVVATQLQDVTLRSNMAVGADASVLVDLKGVSPLDETARRLLAAQVVLTLLGPEVDTVDLQVNGAELNPAIPRWNRSDVESLIGEVPVVENAPALVTSGGRIGQLTGTATPPIPLPGPVGDGRIDARSAAVSVDGVRLAVVSGGGPGAQLLLGRIAGDVGGAVASARTMTRPTWAPTGDEVWSVLDGTAVTRVRIDDKGGTAVDTVDPGLLASLGPITDLRLSRDGVRVLVVAGAKLYAGAVQRGLKGAAAILDIRRLATSLGAVTSADWRDVDSVMALTPDNPLVVKVSVDGLTAVGQEINNLPPAVSAVASSRPDQPVLVANQYGLWSYAAGAQNYWKQIPGSAEGSIPSYPG